MDHPPHETRRQRATWLRAAQRVAASLDGYIADRSGEADWITKDPDIAFGKIFSQYDTHS